MDKAQCSATKHEEVGLITAEPITTHEQLEAAYQQAIRGRHIGEIAPILALRNKALECFFPSEMAPSAFDLASEFHRIYERLAPHYGYETREETRQFDPASTNGKLMLATCEKLRQRFASSARATSTNPVVQELVDELRPAVMQMVDPFKSYTVRLSRAKWSALYTILETTK